MFYFLLGKDKAVKGEGWAPSFISCAQDTEGLKPPLPLRILGYGKPLPYIYLTSRNDFSLGSGIYSLTLFSLLMYPIQITVKFLGVTRGHMTSKYHRTDFDATSSRRVDVRTTSFRCHVPAGL